jgi:hypothetical protein
MRVSDVEVLTTLWPLVLGCNDCYLSKHFVETRFATNLIVYALLIIDSDNKEDNGSEWRGTPLLSAVHTDFFVWGSVWCSETQDNCRVVCPSKDGTAFLSCGYSHTSRICRFH